MNSICKSCLCNEYNENRLNKCGGKCEFCSRGKCEDTAQTICQINKYHDDYGEGQGK